MSNTVFVDQTTIVVAAWLNDINNVVYNLLGNGTIVPATVAALRTNIGLGTIATQNSSSVSITGGTITGTTFTGNITGNASGTAAGITGINPVANGGTGLSAVVAYSPVITGTTTTGAFQATLGPGTSGQVLTSAGPAALPTWATPAAGITVGTVQASTSGTAIDFNSLPTGLKRVIISFDGVSTNGSQNLIVQLGVGGVLQTTGYTSAAIRTIDAGAVLGTTSTNGFVVEAGVAAGAVRYGQIVLTLVNAATGLWVYSATTSRSDAIITNTAAGSKSLSGVLERLRITTTAGVETFDAGSINIQYE